jgi:hypothetical protein
MICEKVSGHFRYATLVEGFLKNEHYPFRCLFVGNTLLARYLLPKTFEGKPRILKKWIARVPSIKKFIKDQLGELDMCIADLPLEWETEFYGTYNYKTQGWVRQVIDFAGLGQPNKNRNERIFKDTERRIRKYGFSYAIIKESGEFNNFYYNMYLPLTQKRFGPIAQIQPYEEMKRIFSEGHLLQVIQDGKVIAGSLNIVRDEVLIGHRLGVLDGREDLIKMGAQSAVYYFTIRYSQDHHFKKMDLLESRPFFKDGVYSHKRDWGASVYPNDKSRSWLYFFYPRCSEKTISFFRNNPLITHVKAGLMGLVGLDTRTEVSDKTGNDLVKRFYAPGLQGLTLLVPHLRNPVELSFGEC